MRGLPWFRVYVQLFSNPKVGMVVSRYGESAGWRLVGLWALASAADGCLPPDLSHIAFWLRISEDEARLTLDQFKAAKLLDEDEQGLRIHDWKVWQFASDNSTERVRAHRSNKKQAKQKCETFHETAGETNTKRSSNGPNRADKTRTEQEQIPACGPILVLAADEVFERCYAASVVKRDRGIAERYFAEAITGGASAMLIESRWREWNAAWSEDRFLKRQTFAEWLLDRNWLYPAPQPATQPSGKLDAFAEARELIRKKAAAKAGQEAA